MDQIEELYEDLRIDSGKQKLRIPSSIGAPAGFVRNEMSYGDCQEND